MINYMNLEKDKFMEEQSTPRVGVFICRCGDEISNIIDTEQLRQRVANMPGVVYTTCEAYPCSKDGQERLRKVIADENLERVLIAGCTPRLIEKLFRRAVESAGLEESYLDIANIREQCAYVHRHEPDIALNKATGLIEIGLERLSAITPTHTYTSRVVKSAMVIGSGLSGLTVALALADGGISVTLVESSGALGEVFHHLQEHSADFIAERVEKVNKHPRIMKMLNAQVSDVSGHPGGYQVTITQEGKETVFATGAIIVATGAKPKDLGEELWFDRKRVKTQVEYEVELEKAVKDGKLAFKDVVMILGTEEEGGARSLHLSSVAALRQAIITKHLNPDANVTILFRDLYLGTPGASSEDTFHQASKAGVTFFRYQSGLPPIIGDITVNVQDALTKDSMEIPFDRVVLATPLVPVEGTDKLATLLNLPQDKLGFIDKPHRRLRPGRYIEDGVYVVGGVHQPSDTAETLFQAYVVSARVLRFLNQDTITLEAPVSQIDSALCTGCGNCVQVCAQQAIRLEKRDGILSLSEVDFLKCIGCGNCAVVCPVKAITHPGWEAASIPAQIDAALRSLPDSEAADFAEAVPKIVVLACEWSAYAAADLSGVRHMQHPANVRIIRMNCSARFDPFHILWAFLKGADGIYLGACPPGDCHYGNGNLYAQERIEALKWQMEEHGFDPQRLHLEFLSGDDGHKFVESLLNFREIISGLTEKTTP